MIITQTEADFILSQLNDSVLTDWELGFVRNIRSTRDSNIPLTFAQLSTLTRIWDKQEE